MYPPVTYPDVQMRSWEEKLSCFYWLKPCCQWLKICHNFRIIHLKSTKFLISRIGLLLSYEFQQVKWILMTGIHTFFVASNLISLVFQLWCASPVEKFIFQRMFNAEVFFHSKPLTFPFLSCLMEEQRTTHTWKFTVEELQYWIFRT